MKTRGISFKFSSRNQFREYRDHALSLHLSQANSRKTKKGDRVKRREISHQSLFDGNGSKFLHKLLEHNHTVDGVSNVPRVVLP